MAQTSLEQIAADLRHDGESATALMDRAAADHGDTKPDLNAYRTWAGDRAASQAQAADLLLRSGMDLGPLMGIPISVKDIYGVPGLPTFAGGASELPEDFRRPGPVIARVQSQVGAIIGKTHSVEFAFKGLGTNPHWGKPVNP